MYSSITQVSICGKVTDATTDLPLREARIEIITGPDAFLIKRASVLKQPVITETKQRTLGFDLFIARDDGSYFFTNLPEGNYQLRCYMKRPTVYIPIILEDVTVQLAEATFPPMTNFALQVR